MPKLKKKDIGIADIDEIVISHSDLRKAISSAYYAGHEAGRYASTGEQEDIEAEFNLVINP